MSILKAIYDTYEGISLFGILLVFQISLLIQNRERNFNHFNVMIKNLFSLSSLFTNLRYSLFYISLHLLINHVYYSLNTKDYFSYEYPSIFVGVNFLYIAKGLTIVFLIFLILYLLSRYFKRFEKYFIGFDSNDIYNFFIIKDELKTFILSLLYRLSSIALFVIFLFISDYLICFLDLLLIDNNYYPFTNNINTKNGQIDLSYKNGIYLSMMVSIFCMFLLINVLFKRDSKYYDFVDSFIQLFAITICCFGIFEGLYSIFNIFNNFLLSSKTIDWVKQYISIGYISIKITSLILMWAIFKYCYLYLFKGNFIKFFSDAIAVHNPSKFRPDEDSVYHIPKGIGEFRGLYSNYFDNYYFIQVGFYISNVLVADFLISIGDLNITSSILFILLPIFVDDYLAIHWYFKKFGEMYNFHRIKKDIFNVLLFLFSVLSLFTGNHIAVGILYIFISAFLLGFYYYNHEKAVRTPSYY